VVISRIVWRRNLDFRRHLHSAGEDTGRSPENETLRRKIFVSSGAANFTPIISPRRPLPPPHRRLTDSLFGESSYSAANFICWRPMRFAGRKRDSTPGSEIRRGRAAFFGRGRGRIAGNLEPHTDFRCCSPPVKSSAENRAARRLYRRLRRSFGTSAGNPPESRKFPAVTRSFRSSAEKRNLQRKFQKFSGIFDFPAECFVLR
jgi:hypothetical protein